MSLMTKPILLCDMDGPLADFDSLFFARCAEAGFEMDCDRDGQRHRFATSHIPDRRHRKAAREMVHNSRWFLDIPVTEGAQEGIEFLTVNFDVWICTKPLEANLTCRDDKARWLVKHFGSYWEDRLIITPDKSLIVGDILLDDAPKHEWIERATWEPVVFPTTWTMYDSEWSHLRNLRSWTWGDPIDDLLGLQEKTA
jgi:5'-nucleotidase